MGCQVPSLLTENDQVQGQLRNAYLFYTVASSVPVDTLVNSLLVMANNCGFDACTALGVGPMLKILQGKTCQFVRGTGTLRYYLFNWRGMQLEAPDIHFVAL